jgi:hypothetical protein
LAASRSDALEVYRARAQIVWKEDTWVPNFIMGYTLGIREDHLAAAFMDFALNGHSGDIVKPKELFDMGLKLVKERPIAQTYKLDSYP